MKWADRVVFGLFIWVWIIVVVNFLYWQGVVAYGYQSFLE
jgi:hypothetical protein